MTPFLKSEKVNLCLIDESMKSRYLKFINDQEVTRLLDVGTFPQSEVDMNEYIADHNKDMLLGICVESQYDRSTYKKEKYTYIGNIKFHKRDVKNGHGEIGMFIGDKHYQHKGYGEAALKLLVDHLFSRVNINKLNAVIVETNIPSKKLFEKIGFNPEGYIREMFYYNGTYLDMVHYGLLRKEYIN